MARSSSWILGSWENTISLTFDTYGFQFSNVLQCGRFGIFCESIQMSSTGGLSAICGNGSPKMCHVHNLNNMVGMSHSPQTKHSNSTLKIILQVNRHFDWHTQNSQHFRHEKTQRYMTKKNVPHFDNALDVAIANDKNKILSPLKPHCHVFLDLLHMKNHNTL